MKKKKKYEVIKDVLIDNIHNGEYVPGIPIPSERELAHIFQVNRMTVRRAIEDLMYEGLLIRKIGSGTFISDPKTGRTSWKEEGLDEGSVKIISCKPGNEIAYGYKALNIPVGTSYWRMRRVRYIEGIPFAYEDIYFHPDFFVKLSKDDFPLGLRSLIRQYVADHSTTVYEEVESLLCLKNTALLLSVEIGSPILQIKSYFVHLGETIVHCRSYHPGDSYKYQSESVIL